MRPTSRPNSIREKGSAGFTFSELLIVVALIGIAVAISVPLVAEQVRQARIKGVGDQLAMDLKAARMIAVSKRSPVNFTVATHPSNYYEYTDAHGRQRKIMMPVGVRITSSTNPIVFQVNGALNAAATTVLEVPASGNVVFRTTVDTSLMGVSTITRERVTN